LEIEVRERRVILILLLNNAIAKCIYITRESFNRIETNSVLIYSKYTN
jgi:hypothetical protein